MTPLIEARELGKVYSGGFLAKRAATALDAFSTAVPGDGPSFIDVAGESGSGKTTLAQLLLGSATPTRGELLYRGKDIRKLSREERRSSRRHVQAVFQDPFEVELAPYASAMRSSGERSCARHARGSSTPGSSQRSKSATMTLLGRLTGR